MIDISIPGFGEIMIEHLVLDYNGTLAVDGKLIDGVTERLQHLARKVKIHVITADTFGSVKEQLQGIDCQLAILPAENQHIRKLNYVTELGANRVMCIGNGRNDHLMLQNATLGVAVMHDEGMATAAMNSADLIMPDILTALDLLSNSLRLIATLRC